MFLNDFTFRKLMIDCFQKFLEVFIPCLSLMIVGKLQLTVMRETGFENRVVRVTSYAFNAFAEREIRIIV